MVLCIIGSIVYAISFYNKRNLLSYLDIKQSDNEYNIAYNFFVRFGNWILIFTNFVPISLLVTLEMVKFI